jgi:hypothetical protein
LVGSLENVGQCVHVQSHLPYVQCRVSVVHASRYFGVAVGHAGAGATGDAAGAGDAAGVADSHPTTSKTTSTRIERYDNVTTMKRTIALLLVAACNKHADEPPPAPPSADQVFWKWFENHAITLAGMKDPVEIVNQIQAELDKAEPDVFAELGSSGSDRLLVLTADGKKDRFDAVKQLYAARPTVAGWKIVAFRQRDDAAEHVTQLDKSKPEQTAPGIGAPTSIEMNGKKLDRASLRYTSAPHGDKLDIDVYIPGYTEADKTLASLAFVALDHTLGEYDVEMKIGGIDLHALTEAPATAHPLTDLPREVDALPK